MNTPNHFGLASGLDILLSVFSVCFVGGVLGIFIWIFINYKK